MEEGRAPDGGGQPDSMSETRNWKIAAFASSGTLLSLIVFAFNFWADFKITQKDNKDIKAEIRSIKRNNEALADLLNKQMGLVNTDNGKISGTVLSEMVGTRKNLEEVRADINDIKNSVQSLDKNIADIKQKFIFGLAADSE